MVTALRSNARARAWALGLLVLSINACSSFNPVAETRYELLNGDANTYKRLNISGARWVGFDDQHSATFSCTNAAAGDHDGSECSQLYKEVKFFQMDGPKCDLDPTELDEAARLDEPGNDGLWVQGELRPLQSCKNTRDRCHTGGMDVAYMWGAGVGLMFSDDGTVPWSADGAHVRGVAFDFVGSAETRANFRVGIPTQLDGTDKVPTNQPLIRADGTVLATDGKVYNCNDLSKVEQRESGPRKLSDVLPDGESGPLSSVQYPTGSSFWQLNTAPPPRAQPSTSSWEANPVVEGHNEFEWSQVLPPPPSEDGKSYSFDKNRILGIQFLMAHKDPPVTHTIRFAFRIRNLALLLE